MPLGERPEPRIVGSVSPEEKEKVRQIVINNFREGRPEGISEKILRELEALEYKKEDWEREVIDSANTKLGKLRASLGLEQFNIPEKNILILPADQYEKAVDDNDTFGTAFNKYQIAAINATKIRANPLQMAKTMIHEMTHLEGYYAFEAEEENGDFSSHRTGLAMAKTVKGARRATEGHFPLMFGGLNEAVVEDIAKSVLLDIREENEKLSDEVRRVDKFAKEKEAVAKKRKIPVEEVFWVSGDGKEGSTYSYYAQREILRLLVEAISEDSGETPEQVKQKFYKAFFSGRVVELGRLVEKSFGKGAFRELGMMRSSDDGTAWSIMDSFKKKRRLLGFKK